MKKLAGFLGVLLLVACAPLAQAAIQISIDSGGGPAICGTNASSAGPVTCSAVAGPGFTIDVLSASSNSPGSPALSQQFGSTLVIRTTAAVDLTIYMSAQGFNAPTTPPGITYASSLSITATTGTGTADLTSCVDTSNGLTPPTNPFCSSPAATIVNDQESYSGASSDSKTKTTTISTLTTTPYALAQQITLHLGAGSNLNVISSQVLSNVPEPASFAFLGTMLLGAGAVLRKKLMNRA